MNIVDIGIIIFILFGALLGFKRGFTKQLVKGCGFIAVVIVAYLLKNPLSILLYENLPFWNLGILHSVEILNILLYEFIAFILCLVVLGILLKIVLLATTIFEKILNATIVLGIPSKIGGAIVGVFTHYIAAFVILYVLSLPFFKFPMLNESNLSNRILKDTPVLSNIADNTVAVANEFFDLKKQYDDKSISDEQLNYQAIELFLKYNVIKPESLEKLIEKGKMKPFNHYMDLINKYKGEENGTN